MYPLLTVNLDHMRKNIRTVRGLCAAHGISVTAVTKVFRGDPRIAGVLAEEGMTMLGDSRVANLARMREVPAEKWLIRIKEYEKQRLKEFNEKFGTAFEYPY